MKKEETELYNKLMRRLNKIKEIRKYDDKN